MKKIIKNVIKTTIFTFFSILLSLSIYIDKSFNNVTFEQLIYSAFNSEGTNFSVILKGIIFVSVFTILIFLLYSFFLFINKKISERISAKIFIKYKKKEILINFFKHSERKINFILIIYCIISIIISIKLFKIDEYIYLQLNDTNLFDEYYVDPFKTKINFPEKKKNLIYIYVESLENTSASNKNGGDQDISFIPNLERLGLDKSNINFSNTDKLGGALYTYGASWTTGAMIAQTAGVPLKVSIDGNNYKNLGGSLPGVYSLGEILEKNGYTNYLMIGSDSDFGGRKDYFNYHGNYKIYDYYWAIDENLIDKDYKVWWGYEDKKLFSYARDVLSKISKSSEPFNFTLLTVDTHFEEGYLDKSCETPFDSHYRNVYYCSDSMISDFIEWIKKQDFYENTTIIITGDHENMQSDFYNLSDGYTRTIYNVFMNSSINTDNNKNRLFLSFDMFPTTLAALGAEIEGDRLGLGTNLFSNKKTLCEELGYEYLDKELAKKSFFYDNYLLGDTYYKMKKDL